MPCACHDQAVVAREGVRPDDPSLCLVCGLKYEPGDEPWGASGVDPTFAYCYCCGVEFGYGDSSSAGIRRWRQTWLDNGATWSDEAHRPQGWNMKDQLARLPERVR